MARLGWELEEENKRSKGVFRWFRPCGSWPNAPYGVKVSLATCTMWAFRSPKERRGIEEVLPKDCHAPSRLAMTVWDSIKFILMPPQNPTNLFSPSPTTTLTYWFPPTGQREEIQRDPPNKPNRWYCHRTPGHNNCGP